MLCSCLQTTFVPNFKAIFLYLAVQMGKKCHIDDGIFEGILGVGWPSGSGRSHRLLRAVVCVGSSPIATRSRGAPHRQGNGERDMFL